MWVVVLLAGMMGMGSAMAGGDDNALPAATLANGKDYQLNEQWHVTGLDLPYTCEWNTPRIAVKDKVLYMVSFKTNANGLESGVTLLRFNASTGERMADLTFSGNHDGSLGKTRLNHRFESVMLDDAGNLVIAAPYNRLTMDEFKTYYDFKTPAKYIVTALVTLNADGQTFDLAKAKNAELPALRDEDIAKYADAYVVDGLLITGDYANDRSTLTAIAYTRQSAAGISNHNEVYEWTTDNAKTYGEATITMCQRGGAGRQYQLLPLYGKYYIGNASGRYAPHVMGTENFNGETRLNKELVVMGVDSQSQRTGSAMATFEYQGSTMLVYADKADAYTQTAPEERMIRFRMVELPTKAQLDAAYADKNAAASETRLWDFPAKGLTGAPKVYDPDHAGYSMENTTAVCTATAEENGVRFVDVYMMGQGQEGTGLACYRMAPAGVETEVVDALVAPTDTLQLVNGTLTAVDPSEVITVYTVTGAAVATGRGTVPTSTLAPGLYIARTATATLKFAK